MFYIYTSNYYLWLGLSSLLYPCQCQWVSDDAVQRGVLQSISDDDVFIFDASSELYSAYNSIRQQKVFPRFIYLKQKTNISLELLIKYCEVVDLNDSLKKICTHILKPKRTLQYQDPILSAREALSLNLSITGLTVKQISEVLGVDGKTIYAHRLNACRKLGVQKVGDLIPFKNLVLLKTAEVKIWHGRPLSL